MQYLFLGFTLDSTKKELYHQSKKVELTKQNYQLLYFFVQNPGIVVDKDQLIDEVWKGRVVADNTVDQSIYKLKKVLSLISDEQYFETIYGLGTKFLPEVAPIPYQSTKSNLKKSFFAKKILLQVLMTLSLVFISWFFYSSNTNNNSKSLFLILSNSKLNTENDWLQNSPNLYVENILSLSTSVTLKHYKDKPDNLNQQQYLEAQWKLSPELQVVKSNISIIDDGFIVQFSIQNKQGELNQRTFKSTQLNSAFKQALLWLSKQTNAKDLISQSHSYIPEDPYVLELYMRGLSAENQQKIEESINYFELCRNENPDFHLATIALAKLMDRKGEQLKALALLETIKLINNNPTIEIESDVIRGGILLRQGKPKEAEGIYLALLNKYKDKGYQNLVSLRFRLSILYSTTSRNQQALDELNALEPILIEAQNHEYLAETYQAKGSILLRTGQTDLAKDYVNKAMDIFVKTGDLIGQAKTHSVTARISIQQVNYVDATEHLKQSLNITRSLDYKFGIGATLNEIIGVLILQGKTNEAWRHNQELEKIALEIDFTAMLLASKIHTIEIATLRKQWEKAEIYLKEHLDLALASNYTRGIKQNTILSLSTHLSQNKTQDVPELLEKLELYIKESGESKLIPQLNILKAQYYYSQGLNQKAESLLISSKTLATETQDNVSLIQINNLLAKYYLESKNNLKAMAVLIESERYSPTAIPYLMLKSKAYLASSQYTKALETANMCKRQANDLWTVEDEMYLSKLVELKTSKLN